MAAGPPVRLTVTQQAEVERWLPLAYAMARNRRRAWFMGPYEADDVRSWAVLGLIDAVQKFDPSWSTAEQRDVFFAVYARTRIAGAMVDQFRRESTVQRWRRGRDYFYENPRILRQDPAVMDGFDQAYDGGLLIVDDRFEARAVVGAVLDELDATLPTPGHPRKVDPAEVVRLLIRGHTARRIAVMLRVDESRISQILKRQVRPLVESYMTDR